MKRYFWIIVVILIIPLAVNAHERDMIGGGHMMGSWNITNIFWWIVIPIIFLLIVLFIQFLFKSRKNEPDSFEILKTRFAKGEISKEEFDKMKINLR